MAAFIAAVSLTNVYYIVRRLGDHRKAMRAVVQLRDIFTPALCDAQVVNQAIDAKRPDFEHAIQYFSATHAGAEMIVTRNAKHFARCALPVVTPTEFLVAWEPR